MNLSATLTTAARIVPANTAITDGERQLDYAGFERMVAGVAGSLQDKFRLRSGDRVGMFMENCLEFLPTLYGIWRAGVTAVPINNKLHPKELAWILDNSGAKLCVMTPDLAEKLSELPAGTPMPPVIVTGTRDFNALPNGRPITEVQSEPGDEAWLFYTSGTTGRPKGAVLTHRNMLFMTHCYFADIDFLDPTDTMLYAAPMSHGAGLYAPAFIAKGARNVIVPGSFEPERIFAAIRGNTNVSMFAAPTMVSRLINHPQAGSADTRNLKTITYGGAPMYVADLKRTLEIFGPKLFQIYGQGESPMTITGLPKRLHVDDGHPAYEARLGSAGIPRTGCAVKIVGEDGREVTRGEVGEILTKSDCVMKGYWNNPEANAKSLRDGWLWTGDLGSMDEDGFLTIKDRSKDMIISGGSNIYPREIEEVLQTHAGVLECAVVSRPHADWGEEVIAYVVRRSGASSGEGRQVTEQELDRLCLDNIARFKRPKSYRFIDALPKNNYGKILKTELREKLARDG